MTMTTTPMTNDARVETGNRLALAAGAALLGAGVILVTCILPAEYAVDPLGTGARLGLLPLGETGKQVAALEAAKSQSATTAAPLVHQDGGFKQENVTLPLGRVRMAMTRLDKGEGCSPGRPACPSNTIHAEPDGAPRYAQSYEKKAARRTPAR
jgi:hypothetical protein